MSQLDRQHPHTDISNLGSRELCFDHCTAEEIRASQFWENAAPGAADSIRTELVQYADTTGRVTDVQISGRPGAIVRISRYVGSAFCVRDTYLGRTAEGYSLISNSTLDSFSQEAGYCGNAFIYFGKWRGSTYAVLRVKGERFSQIAVYRMTPMLEAKKVCVVKKAKRQVSDE
ncbi:hypothetical protein [Caballeronia udeis]|uniref:hypothetical protein n=1 Tax=Caballeronia udeis TaxID=1232866 RepID=UPI0012E853C6|nr:hypothetical protein [Caballeronia udeis]